MATGVYEVSKPNLTQWIVSQLDGAEARYPIHSSGPVTSAVLNIMEDKDRSSTVLANTFWQSYARSDAFRRELAAVGVDPVMVRQREFLVVSHGNRYSLLLTDPQFKGEEVRAFNVSPRPTELRLGWERAYRFRNRARRRVRMNPDFPTMPFLAPPQVLTELIENQPFSVVVTAPIEEELTLVPSPHTPVHGQSGTSTAGLYVQDGMQRVGVTAAEHAVLPGSSVTVDGLSGNVLTRDSLTDSCFIHVPGISPRGKPSHGPLQLAPRQHEAVTFEGYATPSGNARIIAWNYELPYIDPNLQQTVRTDLITAQGDSGAALVDTSGYVVGFAHSRSSSSAVATYSSWIWADAVLQRHSLTSY